jgi:hypothetical protein
MNAGTPHNVSHANALAAHRQFAKAYDCDTRTRANTGLAYPWTKGRNEVYVCATSINHSTYSYNNRGHYTTWYQCFPDASWHMDLETRYQNEKDTGVQKEPADVCWRYDLVFLAG